MLKKNKTENVCACDCVPKGVYEYKDMPGPKLCDSCALLEIRSLFLPNLHTV